MEKMDIMTALKDRESTLASLLSDTTNGEYTLEFTTVLKNNVSLYGYAIHVKDSNTQPVIYYSPNWFAKDDAEVVDFILGATSNIPKFDTNILLDPEFIYKHVVTRVIANNDVNKQMLDEKDTYYIEYLDMFAYFFVTLDNFDEGIAGFNLSSKTVSGILDIYELYDNAKLNTIKTITVRSMAEVLSEMMGIEVPIFDDNALKIVTNKEGIGGASIIAFPEVLLNMLDNQDYYILPSSIHEILVMPAVYVADPKDLQAMVTEVNATQVKPQDKLTDSVYFLDCEKCKVSLISTC